MVAIWKQKVLLLLCSIIGIVFTTNENENTCQLCLEEIENDNWEMTNCAHKFCKPCFQDWRERNGTCPECRVNLNSASPLIGKIKANDIGGAKYIVKTNPDTINQCNEENETPLTVAVRNGNLEIVEYLIQIGGMDLNFMDQHGERPIEVALQNNHQLIALKLFEHEASFDDRMEKCNSLDRFIIFDCAVKLGYAPVVQLFINEAKHLCPRALIDAVTIGHLEIAEMLINAYPEMLEETDEKTQNTPLFFAIAAGHVEMVKLLITKGTDVKHKSNGDMTAISFAISMGKFNYDIVQLLIEKDKSMIDETSADLKTVTVGTTPLMFAIFIKEVAIVKLLLKNGADIMKEDLHGWIAVMLAASVGTIEIMDLLIKMNPASVFQTNDRGNCAFTEAVIKQQENIVSYYVKNYHHFLNPTIIQRAFSKPTTKNIIEILKTYEDQSLIYAVCQNNIKKAQNIFKQNSSSMNQTFTYIIDIPNQTPLIYGNQTPLIFAATFGFDEMVIWLLEKNVSITDQDTLGQTALILASGRGHLQIVKRLIKKDSTAFDQMSIDGHSALSWAAQFGQTKVIDYFIANKYELISHNMLQFARKYASTDTIKEKLNRCKSIFECLIEENDEKSDRRIQNILNKNPSAFDDKNEFGKTVFTFAEKVGKKDLINLILKKLETDHGNNQIGKQKNL